MDFQNRAGGKTGGGGVASAQDAGVDRRERLRFELDGKYQCKVILMQGIFCVGTFIRIP